MRADQVIIEPILSEKSNSARESECKKYTFKVDPRANKFEIMAAVKEIFKVNPTDCNVMNMAGKPKFSRGKGKSLNLRGDAGRAVPVFLTGERWQ